MATITIHGGDFASGEAGFSSGRFVLESRTHPVVVETIAASTLETVTLASRNERTAKIRAWGVSNPQSPSGVLGALVSGLWRRKKGRELEFTARFQDGRTLRGTTDRATLEQIRAAGP